MLIGGPKKKVIENIKKNLKEGNFNAKAEIGDPVFTDEDRKKALRRFRRIRLNPVGYFFRSEFAYIFVDGLAYRLNKAIKVEGLENLKKVKTGAIVTSNHFNPLDSMMPRKVIKKAFRKNIYIVSQDTNLAMPGIIGYLINHLNILPICPGAAYMAKTFKPKLDKLLKKGEFVLIYPEEEMWFNYRKPRPGKSGAYRFAAEFNVPVISCFTEMVDTEKVDNEEFYNVDYVAHVLKPIYPDPKKTLKENAREMAEKDYAQRVAAYEKAYGKKLSYNFHPDDIAGWRGN